MRGIVVSTLAAATAGLIGCTANRIPDPVAVTAAPVGVMSELRNVSGAIVARASAAQVGDSIRIKVEATGMRPGSYGAHVHATGRCSPPDFASAGPHWNPTAQQHGKNNPQGMHKGDLPNLLVGTDGRGSFEMTLASASISGGAMPLLDSDGAAVVLHAAPDDYRTDPSGNSGARIACGVLG